MRAQWLHVWNIAFVVKRQPMHAPKGFPAKWGEQENELVLSKSRDGLDAVQRLKKVLFEPPPQQAEAACPQCLHTRCGPSCDCACNRHAFPGISEQCAKCGAWRPGGWGNAPKVPCRGS
jgi:hypothetical protein